jgi:hypothetical protein
LDQGVSAQGNPGSLYIMVTALLDDEIPFDVIFTVPLPELEAAANCLFPDRER